MKVRGWMIATTLLLAFAAAGSQTRIEAKRLRELKPGMSMAEVKAVVGEPELIIEGQPPGTIMMYLFVFIDLESSGLLGEGPALAGFDAGGRLVTFGTGPPNAVDPADGSKLSPHGHSNSLEPFARLDAYATDPGWGYSAERPIAVGGLRPGDMPRSEAAFLNALRGPSGEVVDFERQGACCAFDMPDKPGMKGLLDVFRVTIQGRPGVTLLYLDMYHAGPREVPAGFTYRLKEPALRNQPLARGGAASAAASGAVDSAGPVRP